MLHNLLVSFNFEFKSGLQHIWVKLEFCDFSHCGGIQLGRFSFWKVVQETHTNAWVQSQCFSLSGTYYPSETHTDMDVCARMCVSVCNVSAPDRRAGGTVGLTAWMNSFCPRGSCLCFAWVTLSRQMQRSPGQPSPAEYPEGKMPSLASVTEERERERRKKDDSFSPELPVSPLLHLRAETQHLCSWQIVLTSTASWDAPKGWQSVTVWLKGMTPGLCLLIGGVREMSPSTMLNPQPPSLPNTRKPQNLHPFLYFFFLKTRHRQTQQML